MDTESKLHVKISPVVDSRRALGLSTLLPFSLHFEKLFKFFLKSTHVNTEKTEANNCKRKYTMNEAIW